MQRLMLFVVVLIAACMLTGCITAQQLRERTIAKNHKLFNAFTPVYTREGTTWSDRPWFQSRYGQAGMGQS